VSDQVQRDIARKIVAALYEAWAQGAIVSLFTVRDEGGWDETVFDTVVGKLERRHGLIKSYGSSYTYEITPTGVLYAEDNGIVPPAEAETHRQVRRQALAFLADFYEREGSQADELVEKIFEGSPTDAFDAMHDLSLLADLGYIEFASSSSARITDEGLRHYHGTDFEDII
jgi:hypothetical protein